MSTSGPIDWDGDPNDNEYRQTLAEFGSFGVPLFDLPDHLVEPPELDTDRPRSGAGPAKVVSDEDFTREFVLARQRVSCPDCDIRGDLTSYPDVSQGKPLKIRQGKHGAVKRCGTCNGRGHVARGSASA